MFMLDNFFWILLIGVLLIFAFTFVNIYIDVQHFFTTLLLSVYFYYLYFKAPISFVNRIHANKKEIIKEIKNDKNIPKLSKYKLEKMLRSRTSIFLAYFKLGLFSYKVVMKILLSNYKIDPFIVSFRFFVRINGKTSKELEEKYFKNIFDDFRVSM